VIILKTIILHRYEIKNNKGFTLIEMLVAIGILAVLATAAITVLNPFAQIQKSNDAKRKADLSQIQKALEIYYQDNNKYPANTTAYEISGAAWGSSWQPYMNVIPSDPTTGKNYVYYVTNDGQSYYLYASLDRGKLDPQACSGTNGVCSGAGLSNMETLCGGVCNFGLSSPDVSP